MTEFDAGEDGIAASVTRETLEALRIRASGIFAADLRGKYCRVRPYEDDGELCIAVRHGATLVVATHDARVKTKLRDRLELQ